MTMTSKNSSEVFSNPDYTPRDDMSEAERLVALGGFGQVAYEEDAASFHEHLAGLGIYVDTDGG